MLVNICSKVAFADSYKLWQALAATRFQPNFHEIRDDHLLNLSI
jgi:hypothetical protein